MDVGVVGTFSADGVNEVPRAYVVRKKQLRLSDQVSGEDIYLFARKRLASYKALDGGVIFVEDIPRTASGKIQRFKLSVMDRHRESITQLLLANANQQQAAMHAAQITINAIKASVMGETQVIGGTTASMSRSKRKVSMSNAAEAECSTPAATSTPMETGLKSQAASSEVPFMPLAKRVRPSRAQPTRTSAHTITQMKYPARSLPILASAPPMPDTQPAETEHDEDHTINDEQPKEHAVNKLAITA